jgi:fermentation-respiration switch protein FrsA (DUF1100 family)
MTQELPGWKTITQQRDFFESFRDVDLDQTLAKYPGAFLSVRGSRDFIPPHESEFLKIVKGRPAEAVFIGGADHIFDGYKPALGHADRAVNATVEFLQRTL